MCCAGDDCKQPTSFHTIVPGQTCCYIVGRRVAASCWELAQVPDVSSILNTHFLQQSGPLLRLILLLKVLYSDIRWYLFVCPYTDCLGRGWQTSTRRVQMTPGECRAARYIHCQTMFFFVLSHVGSSLDWPPPKKVRLCMFKFSGTVIKLLVYQVFILWWIF